MITNGGKGAGSGLSGVGDCRAVSCRSATDAIAAIWGIDAVEPKRSDVELGILMVDELSYDYGFARLYRRSKQQIPRMPYEQPAS